MATTQINTSSWYTEMWSAHIRQSVNTPIMVTDITPNLLPLGIEMHVSVVMVMKGELWQYIQYSKPQGVAEYSFWDAKHKLYLK